MTKSKRWPVHAEEARLEALAQATRGLQSLRQILDGGVKDTTDTVRRIGVATDAFHRIIHNLEMAGNK